MQYAVSFLGESLAAYPGSSCSLRGERSASERGPDNFNPARIGAVKAQVSTVVS